MLKFVYQAKKGPKEIVEGIIDAQNKEDAINKLVQKGFFICSITEESKAQSGKQQFILIGKRITSRQITVFTRQLAGLLQSGLTLVKALSILSRQSENKKLQKVTEDVRDLVREGKAFSASLALYPKIFPSLYVNMVKAAEAAGILEKVLDHLADFAEKEDEIKSGVKSAMVYPALITVVGVITVIVLLTFVVPKLVVMFEDTGAVLPLPTRILMGVSGYLTDYWWLIAGAISLAVLFAKRNSADPQRRIIIDRLKLKLPVIGKLIKKEETARLSRTLALLLDNGVSIFPAIEVVSRVIENEFLKQDMERVRKDVAKGEALAHSMEEKGAFSPFVTDMIAVGEESGSLERALFRIADIYEREVGKEIKTLTSLLEPLMVLIVGLIVGIIVIAMLLPIFDISTIL